VKKKIFLCLSNNKVRDWLIFAVSVVVMAFFSFQYALVTKGFPTGDDPAFHILWARTRSYLDLFHSNYPLPEIIFKFIQSVTNMSYPLAFVIVISLFLLISSIAIFFFVKKMTSSNLIALVAGSVFALGIWTVDGLRMGLLAEAFGWGMLIFTLLFLSQGKIILTLIFSFLLLISHPFAFTIYALVFAIYFIISLFVKEERKNTLIIFGVYLTGLVALYLIYPTIIERFKDFINPERAGWGERKIWEVLISNDPLRAVGLLFSVVGLVSAIKEWKKPIIKISYLLLFVGLFLSMNQIFDIRFLVFRFFPYFQMGVVIFLGYGLWSVVSAFKLNKIYLAIFTTLLGFLIIYPHFKGDNIITSYQVNDRSADNSMTKGDQVAIEWVRKNLNSDDYVYAPYKRTIWLNALTSVRGITDNRFFDNSLSNPLPDIGISTYIYYPWDQKPTDYVVSKCRIIYDLDGVKIYTLKK
jgi:hypothetical protein